MDDIVTWLRARAADEANNDEAAKLWAAADLISRLTKERDEAEAWRPIATAPKDQTRILVCSERGHVAIGAFSKTPRKAQEWREDHFHGRVLIPQPNKWIPLPAIRQKSDVPTDVNDMPEGEKP